MTPACDLSRITNYFMAFSRQRSTCSHLANADTSSTPDPREILHHAIRSPIYWTHPMRTSTSSYLRTATYPLAAQASPPLCISRPPITQYLHKTRHSTAFPAPFDAQMAHCRLPPTTPTSIVTTNWVCGDTNSLVPATRLVQPSSSSKPRATPTAVS
jgi:hypothetical protein